MYSPAGARPSPDRTAPKYLALGSAMTFRSSPTEDRNDWMNSAMLEASGPASSTTPFLGFAIGMSARAAATSSAARGWNLHVDMRTAFPSAPPSAIALRNSKNCVARSTV